MSNNLKKVIIATGGTGGHVFPAYGLAMHLKNKKINTEIFSDKRGLEYLKNLKDIKKVKIIDNINFNYFRNYQIFVFIIIKKTRYCFWYGRVFIFPGLFCS